MSEENPPPNLDTTGSSSGPDLDNLPSYYKTNTPPELQPPPPSTEEPEIVQISPDDILLNEATDKHEHKSETHSGHPFGDTSETHSGHPFGDTSAEPSGVPDNWKPNKIMRRADWGAAKPKWIDSLEVPVEKVVVSFTESDPCYTEEECQQFLRNLQKKHMEEEGVPDIKHNFLIGGDEVIYEGRGYMRAGPVYQPSPKKIEELTGKSIDVAIIERSGSKPSKGTVAALSYCLVNAVHERCLIKDFYTYYLLHGEIEHIESPLNRTLLN